MPIEIYLDLHNPILLHHLLNAPDRLPCSVLIFDEAEADVVVAVLAEADAGGDGDFGIN